MAKFECKSCRNNPGAYLRKYGNWHAHIHTKCHAATLILYMYVQCSSVEYASKLTADGTAADWGVAGGCSYISKQSSIIKAHITPVYKHKQHKYLCSLQLDHTAHAIQEDACTRKLTIRESWQVLHSSNLGTGWTSILGVNGSISKQCGDDKLRKFSTLQFWYCTCNIICAMQFKGRVH